MERFPKAGNARQHAPEAGLEEAAEASFPEMETYVPGREATFQHTSHLGE